MRRAICISVESRPTPAYAPAWARLGRIHHVIAKCLPSGTKDDLSKAESDFRQALDLNPDLPIAHKSYAQLEVDLGRASDAICRLIPRTLGRADSEAFAGLVSPLRYCGLLEASAAAHRRAIALEPKIRTSVQHTWFLQGDYARLAALRIEGHPYIVGLSLAEEGRSVESLAALRAIEQKVKTRMGDFACAARALIEGDSETSIAEVERIISSNFGDPEGLYYLARHLAHLNRDGVALDQLDCVVAGGFFCYPAMFGDPWLEPVRTSPRFISLFAKVEQKYRATEREFAALGGGIQALHMDP